MRACRLGSRLQSRAQSERVAVNVRLSLRPSIIAAWTNGWHRRAWIRDALSLSSLSLSLSAIRDCRRLEIGRESISLHANLEKGKEGRTSKQTNKSFLLKEKGRMYMVKETIVRSISSKSLSPIHVFFFFFSSSSPCCRLSLSLLLVSL